MNTAVETNTRSVVRQFRQVLMGLYRGHYNISKISIEPDFDERIMSLGAPMNTGDRILTVKYNIFKKRDSRPINPERMDYMEKGASVGRPRIYNTGKMIKK